MFIFYERQICKSFWCIKITKIQSVTNSSGGFEVPLSLTFSCKEKWVINTLEEFVENFFSFDDSGNLHSINYTNDSDGDEDNDCQTITLATERWRRK